MDKRVLVVGNGYIGNRIREELGYQVTEEKVNSLTDALAVLGAHKPAVVINAAGFTGRNVDDCENNLDKTLEANTFLPLCLAEACLRTSVKLVHISSGCIYHYEYGKTGPIKEEQAPDYLELFYSRSKVYAEAAMETLMKKYPFLQLRVRVPLDNRPVKKDLLSKLITYKKAIDAPNSVTYIPDFIRALKHLLDMDAKGTYNIACKDPLYYPDLLEEYRTYKPDFTYQTITLKELNLVRTNLVLSTDKLAATGFTVRGVKEVIPECVREYVHG